MPDPDLTAPIEEPPTASSSHGHAARRSERRTAALDAFIDLVLEHGRPPRPEEVAERAGVSIASLYRYFSTLDELRIDAVARIADRYPDLLSIPEIGTGERVQRIASFARARVALHETLHPLQQLTREKSRTDAAAVKLVDTGRHLLADQARLHFDAELRALSPTDRDDTVAAIAALTSVESWEQFRRTMDRTPTQTRRAWSRAIERLLPENSRT